MTSWLARQRKQTLLDLSSEAGLKQDDDTRKDEIIDALDAHLQKNQTRLAGNQLFEPYYGTRRTPARPRPSSTSGGLTSDDGTELKSVVKAGGKRAAKVKQESDEPTSPTSSPVQTVVTAASSAANKVVTTISNATTGSKDIVVARKTPARPRRSVLPPSPRDVADQVEEQANKLYAGIDDAINVSGIPEIIDYVREFCSSVLGVQTTFLFLEAFSIQREVLPWRYVADIPWVPILGMPEHFPIKLPDLFILLTSSFWHPVLLWCATSIFLPLLFAYFYNLTIRDVKRNGVRVSVARYDIDPLTFNVVKALGTWLIYGRGNLFGFISPKAVVRVNDAMYGGYNGVLLGAYISILAALYDAAQRK